MKSNEIESIEKKLELLDMKVDAINVTMAKQEVNLYEHMKRSDTLEQMMMQMKKEMKPVEKHVLMVEGVIKFLGVLSLGLSVLGGILKIFGVI